MLIGITISDRYASVASVKGGSMNPTISSQNDGLLRSLRGDVLFVEKLCLDKYKFSRGDVIIFRSPSDHTETMVKRLIALPGDWINVPESSEILKIPEGHCWAEGDNSCSSLDSRSFGSIPLGLIKGRATHVIWPPSRIGTLEKKVSTERIVSNRY